MNWGKLSYEKEWYKNGVLRLHYLDLTYDTIIHLDTPSNEEHIIVLRTMEGYDFFSNGKRKLLKNVIKGKKEGQWIYWDSLGSLIKQENYKKDSLINFKNFK